MSTKGNLPLASKKQEYIDGLGNAHEWTNADTCVKGNLMFLDIVEVNPETGLPADPKDSVWYGRSAPTSNNYPSNGDYSSRTDGLTGYAAYQADLAEWEWANA